MFILLLILSNVVFMKTEPLGLTNKPTNISISGIQTRRILKGKEVGNTRPYMVYLRPAAEADDDFNSNWLCGGVIIHPRYVLTSAACIEDVRQFYVVSGTHRWVPSSVKDDECVKNGAKKAVWKCVPKSYFFDGNEFDNIRWMVNDIAVVKVEDDFNFKRRVRGCDFIPSMIAFNNQSEELERPSTVASIAGWGTTEQYGNPIARAAANSPVLLETDVVVVGKQKCKKRWEPRYHHIIDQHMICGKDGLDSDTMSGMCAENEVNCKELVYSDEYDEEDSKKTRRMVIDPRHLIIHSARHYNQTRRKVLPSGFCENDHGGPLVVGHGKSATVVGVISACLTKNLDHKCYGPFLYTSVWKNRNVIACAIDKEIGATCRRLLKSSGTQLSETIYNWSGHTNGPAVTTSTSTIKDSTIVRLRSRNLTRKISSTISKRTK